MGQLLDDLQNEKPSELRQRSIDSMNWFRNNLRQIRVRHSSLLDEFNATGRVELGKIYMFFYDAKTQDKLPYWDYFPLCIPIKKYKTGFMGLNLHYLAPRYRVRLLDAMYGNMQDNVFDINYKMVKSIGNLRWAKPCVKQYQYGYFNSYIKEVQTAYYDIVAMLPTQSFNVNANTVYSDSLRKI